MATNEINQMMIEMEEMVAKVEWLEDMRANGCKYAARIFQLEKRDAARLCKFVCESIDWAG